MQFEDKIFSKKLFVKKFAKLFFTSDSEEFNIIIETKLGLSHNNFIKFFKYKFNSPKNLERSSSELINT